MPFSLQAASEAMHASIFPNHSMAGNDDRYWISARGRPGGADGLGRPCPVGQVGVGDSFSIGDERDFAPDLLLEIGAGQAQRERETFSLSRKIFLELLRRLLKNRVLSIERPTATRGGNVIAADKIHASQGGGVGDQHELTYWAFEDGIVVPIVSVCFMLSVVHCHFLKLAASGRIARRFRSWKQNYFDGRKWRELPG